MRKCQRREYSILLSLLSLFVFLSYFFSGWGLGSSCNMTKRDSVAAGFTFPPCSMNMPRRHSRSAGHAGNTSDRQESSAPSSSCTTHYDHRSWHTSRTQAYVDHSHSSEYGVPPSPTPVSTTSGYQTPIIPQREVDTDKGYPLQHQIEEHRRQLHAHYFVEVSIPQADPSLPAVRHLMVTEVVQQGIHRNRQPEYFFNGIVGHIRACRNGWIDSWSWTQSNLLANYWRRHFNIPEEIQTRTDTRRETEERDSPMSGQESNMEDTDSVTANVDINPPPVQIHQLATILWNILNNDRDPNQAILECLEDTDDDLLRHPVLQTWLTLPAIWQKPLAIWRTKPITWRPSLTSATELGHKDFLSLQFNSPMATSLYFDFAIIATSSVRAPIRAQRTFLRKKPRGSEACVWTI